MRLELALQTLLGCLAVRISENFGENRRSLLDLHIRGPENAEPDRLDNTLQSALITNSSNSYNSCSGCVAEMTARYYAVG